MQNHEKPNEPRLSAERIAELDNSRAARAEVEDRVVGALQGKGVLRNDRDAFAARRAANAGGRRAWIAGLAVVAATVMFFAGVKVGESGTNERAAGVLASSAASADAPATTCPAVTLAAGPSQSQLIWY